MAYSEHDGRKRQTGGSHRVARWYTRMAQTMARTTPLAVSLLPSGVIPHHPGGAKQAAQGRMELPEAGRNSRGPNDDHDVIAAATGGSQQAPSFP